MASESEFDAMKQKVNELKNLVADMRQKRFNGGLPTYVDIDGGSGDIGGGGGGNVPIQSYPAVPPRQYSISQLEPELYNPYNPRLPTKSGKQKHPYTGRFGSTADLMKAQYQVKVPMPKDAPDSDILVDGTVDINHMALDFGHPSDVENVEVIVQDFLFEILDKVDCSSQVNVNIQEDSIVSHPPSAAQWTSRAYVYETVEVIDGSQTIEPIDGSVIDFIAEPVLTSEDDSFSF